MKEEIERDPKTQLDNITTIFKEFGYETLKEKVRNPHKESDNKSKWEKVIAYLISLTAKDFTIIIREVNGSPPQVGIIDLECKLYTKLPQYLLEMEEAFSNFINRT